jgi:Reverse transcriptase (RNA-dependent DNA polymerase)
MLILWITNNYYAEVADIQTAFLHGNLEEELYLKEPEGYQEFLGERQSINHYLKLNKSIYGFV